MPIYEYRCESCGHKFERRRCMSDADAAVDCPECGAAESRRLMSACAVFSKGDGGTVSSVGGSSCGSCSGSNCSGCGH